MINKAISLVEADILVSDPEMTHRMCRLFQQSTPIAVAMKNPLRAGQIEITLRDNSILALGLRKSGGTTCLTIDSNGEDGWHYGDLETTGLGSLIDSICVKTAKHY
jgi:hypothetical protein